jgi:hypothetical protein
MIGELLGEGQRFTDHTGHALSSQWREKKTMVGESSGRKVA